MFRRIALPLLVAALAAGSLHCGTSEDDTGGGTAGSGATPGGGGNDGGSAGNGTGGTGGTAAGGTGGGTGGTGGTGSGGTGGTLPGTGGTSGTIKGLDCPGTNTGCACSDGIDNDLDGLADEFDPECSGPYDNDEATFWTGIPGDNKGSSAATECFFDGNSGPGNDARCAEWTPNGCDCFGCCWIDVNGNGTPEQIGMFTGCKTTRDPGAAPGTPGGACRATGDACDTGLSCMTDGDGTTRFCTACGSCTQNTECVNPCEAGEDCIGEPPGSGSGGGGTGGGTGGTGGGGTEPVCAGGRTSCTVHADCPGASEFCVTGCCQLFQ
jgi:hypothetical protein